MLKQPVVEQESLPKPIASFIAQKLGKTFCGCWYLYNKAVSEPRNKSWIFLPHLWMRELTAEYLRAPTVKLLIMNRFYILQVDNPGICIFWINELL